MAKLVILTQGLSGRAHELNVDCTTVGRVEDNMFQIAEPSVSSHHCEIHLRGAEIFIRDLNSTNGTFINGEKISEGVLKPGQTLRLGNVELKLDTPGAPATPPPKKKTDAMKQPRGVSLSELEVGRTTSFDTSKEFSKKRNKAGIYFWIGATVILLLIAGLVIYNLIIVNSPQPHH
jgi:pSer/pThr/pTyr-binding forkhead associated (FHA) protein